MTQDGKEKDMSKTAQAFNAWMEEYTKHPERFEAEWKTVGLFLAEQNAGNEPSYGEKCEAILRKYEKAIGR